MLLHGLDINRLMGTKAVVRSEVSPPPSDPYADRLVHIGESCTLIGWRLGAQGRKHEAGTAIFDGKGQLCGKARAVWMELRSSAAVSELAPVRSP
jgi:hypothetical protein